MTPERRRQVASLCLQALGRDAAERAAFLDEACGEDTELRREVKSMLAVQADAQAFLDTPAWSVPAVPLAPGTRLGPYEIHALIGAGGMGVVYKARDTRLDRTVAIKVLPPAVASDPERRARFEVEAKTIAGLSHPHICTLHDVGDHDGSMFLVMEHLAGQTLAERLLRGALPPRQALATAAEIADALSAAHRQGVVHRDLKPGNVMLTKSGAKLLDFGLAKLKRAAGASSAPTRSSGAGEPQTEPGTLLGTVPYMAPEQIEGRDADAQSDIFSFGAVLYEMVTGRRAFEGESHASVAAAILEHEPAPVSSLQPQTPPMLDRLVRRCLAKSPDDRPDSARDVANDLRWMRDTSDAAVIPAGTHRRRWSVLRASVVTVSLLAAALVAAGVMASLRPVPPRHLIQSALSVGPAEALDGGTILGSTPGSGSGIPLTRGGSRTAVTWSPDGRLVFVGRRDGVRRLYVRRLEAARSQELPNTEGAQAPAVSPDGQWVAFWADGAIKKVPLAGGQAVNLASSRAPFGFAWNTNGRLLFGKGGEQVYQVSSAEAPPTRVSPLDPEHNRHDLPFLLPGGRTLLYTGKKRVYSWGSDEEILAQDLATGTTKALPIRDATDVRYVQSGRRTGHLLFLRRGVLFAVAFDPERVEVVGEQEPVLEGTVAQALTGDSSDDITGAGHFAVSPAGMLAWVPGPIVPYTTKALVTVDRLGHVTAIRRPSDGHASGMSISPRDRRLAFTIRSLAEVSLGIGNLGHGAPTLINTEGESMWPVWWPDGRRIAYLWLNDGQYLLVSQAADEPASHQVLATGVFIPTSFTPDGRHLVAVRGLDGIVSLTTDAPAAVQSVLETPDVERWPLLSPDGKWLAYGSDATGRPEVYVRPYPAPGRVEPVSGDGGSSPVWRPDGRELFFVAPAGEKARMMAVDFAPGSPPRIGQPRVLFEFDPRDLTFDCSPGRCYEVTPDGRQFYVWQNSIPPALPPVTHINIIENWVGQLAQKAPARK